MATKPNNQRYITNRHITQAMAACLRMMLEDIRAQYQTVLSDAERLKDTGAAAKKVYTELSGLNEWAAQSNEKKASPNRRVRRP